MAPAKGTDMTSVVQRSLLVAVLFIAAVCALAYVFEGIGRRILCDSAEQEAVDVRPSASSLRCGPEHPGGEILVTVATNTDRQWHVPWAVDSLHYQSLNATCIVVVLNGYTAVPTHWAVDERIVYHIPAVDLGSSGKFFDRAFISRFRYHLTADDGIIYPYNYVERMVEQITVLGGTAMVGLKCKRVDLIRHGALAWLTNAKEEDEEVQGQRSISTRRLQNEASALVLAAFMHKALPINAVQEYRGGYTDVLELGAAGYSTSRFQWSIEDMPPQGLLLDYTTAMAAKKQGLDFYCMPRRSNWLRALPGSWHVLQDTMGKLPVSSRRLQDILLAAVELDVIQNRNINRTFNEVAIQFGSATTWIGADNWLLPFACGVYFTRAPAAWKCRPVTVFGVQASGVAWQVQMLRRMPNVARDFTVSPPVMDSSAVSPCLMTHVIIATGGPARQTAVARSILSAAKQLYKCIMIWVVPDRSTHQGITSRLYNRVVKTACDRSPAPGKPGFVTVPGFWGAAIPVGCINTAMYGKEEDDVAAHRRFLGLSVASAFSTPGDVLLNLEGGDQLVHPQALAIVSEAYKAGCWSAWGAALNGAKTDSGPLPVEAMEADNSAHPRKGPWVYGSPRSFVAGLFKHLSAADFKLPDGLSWRSKLYDRVSFYRIIELSGADRACYVNVPLSVSLTNAPGEFDDPSLHTGQRRQYTIFIRNMTHQSRLNSLLPS
eukprot:TRINITY_DN39978_c0_g1_i1.p1 TRINITY_DN39978_c0_g1~~TRINITY_DN39978_c0_g1_i1.p1  ORF type:complete len:741 (+),score=62.87 TRINITY_DN39978_c0_g1_i1:77-2224(+)